MATVYAPSKPYLMGLAGLSFIALLPACQSPGQGAKAFTARCADGLLDGLEGDVDCGGGCGLCSPGQSCRVASDCTTATCTDHVCAVAAPTCDDGTKNGAESDQDCGGGTCDGCSAGRACHGPSDCVSGACVGNVCVAPSTCGDAQLSPGETDLDCGGACSPCATGLKCKAPGDCLSATCLFGICRDPTCSDGVRNQDETDLDCGGSHCKACEDGLRCARPEDCGSGRCDGGVCASCTDKLRNGSETAVDCGGSCPPCADLAACADAADCVSGRCSVEDGAKLCTSCGDHLQDGDESDVDCGGSCGPCALGGHCARADDCGEGICEGTTCCTPNRCGHCGAAPSETCNGLDDDCDGQTDEAAEVGAAQACSEQRGVCAGATTRCHGAAGWSCSAADLRAHDAAYEETETTCDGLDNDCDGQTDEGLLNACGTCGPAPIEVCDGLDNDCDGQTDEGVKNRCGGCGPEPLEQCNGVDDDCDGQTDELAECAACSAHPTPVVIATAPAADNALWVPEANAITTVGTEAFIVGGLYGDAHVYRLSQGTSATEIAGASCEWGNAIGDADGSPATLCSRYVNGDTWLFDRMSRTGVALASVSGSFAGLGYNSFDILSRGGEVAAFTSTGTDLLQFDPRQSDAIPEEVTAALDGYSPRGGGRAVFDAKGRRVVLWQVSDPFGTYGIAWRVDDKPAAIMDPRGGGYNMSLLAAATGRVMMVMPNNSSSPWRYLDRDATSWTVGTPSIPSEWDYQVAAVESSAYGQLMVLHVLDPDETGKHGRLVLSWAAPGGAWIDTTIQAFADGQRSYYEWARARLDAAGRLHVVYAQGPTSIGLPDTLNYLMVCPAMTCSGPGCAPVVAGGGIPDRGPDPAPTPAAIVINEVVYDTPGADTDVFVELAGPPGTSLAGYSLVGINGLDGMAYKTVALSGAIPASGYYLVVGNGASAGLKGQAQLVADVDFQNGPDSIQLKAGSTVVDALAYGTFAVTDVAAGEGEPKHVLPANVGSSLARMPDGTDSGINANDFATDATPTPGSKNL